MPRQYGLSDLDLGNTTDEFRTQHSQTFTIVHPGGSAPGFSSVSTVRLSCIQSSNAPE